MSNEFIVGVPLAELRSFIQSKGWRECGRAAWQKRDGTVVHYLAFPEQLEAVPSGATVHVVGKASEFVRLLKRSGAIIVPHSSG